MLLLKILVFVVGLGAGVGFIKYSYPLTQLFGFNSLAERYLGSGGTYTMWKILGVLVIVGTIWYVFG
jgi:hypothetical protein